MIKWNASPIIFEIGGFALRYYSLMFVLGFIISGEIVKKIFAKNGKNPELISSLTTHVIIGMLLGARLVHCLFYEPDIYLYNPLGILKVWEGGLASHGGYLGVVVAVGVFLKKHKDINFLWLLDVLSAPGLMMGGLIRIGNLFNSEIVGNPTTVPWAFIFERLDNVPRHPAQLYEAIGYFAVSYTLFFMQRKKSASWAPGSIFASSFILGFTFRFFIEFFKGVQSSLLYNSPINMGQILSLVFVIAGISMCLVFNRKRS